METYYDLSQMIVRVAIVFQIVSIVIFIWALLKHRRFCFGLFTFGAILGLAYALLAGIPLFVRISLHDHIVLARLLLGLTSAMSIVGLWGWILIVRSYRSSV